MSDKKEIKEGLIKLFTSLQSMEMREIAVEQITRLREEEEGMLSSPAMGSDAEMRAFRERLQFVQEKIKVLTEIIPELTSEIRESLDLTAFELELKVSNYGKEKE